MTVKQLINKLSKMPEGAKVISVNTEMYVSGAYEINSVEDWKDGTVLLDSDYKKNFWNEDQG